MLRFVLEAIRDAIGLTLFLSAIALICAPDRAMAADGAGAITWHAIAGGVMLALFLAAVVLLALFWRLLTQIGDDVAAHERNDGGE